MSSKILNVVLGLTLLISLNIFNTANAALIVGDVYTDSNDVTWEYVGSFDLLDGEYWGGNDANSAEDNATPLNGLQTAESIFGSLVAGDLYAISTLSENSINYVINHNAWYDSFVPEGPAGANVPGIEEKGEGITANVAGTSTYDALGDVSAFIQDRGNLGGLFPGDNGDRGLYINHVFKSASIPEPTTISVFVLGFLGLMLRKSRS